MLTLKFIETYCVKLSTVKDIQFNHQIKLKIMILLFLIFSISVSLVVPISRCYKSSTTIMLVTRTTTRHRYKKTLSKSSTMLDLFNTGQTYVFSIVVSAFRSTITFVDDVQLRDQQGNSCIVKQTTISVNFEVNTLIITGILGEEQGSHES